MQAMALPDKPAHLSASRIGDRDFEVAWEGHDGPSKAERCRSIQLLLLSYQLLLFQSLLFQSVIPVAVIPVAVVRVAVVSEAQNR